MKETETKVHSTGGIGKKGLSPLSSTIILLIVSIIIGIIVMSWGRSYVEQSVTQADQNKIAEKQTTTLEDLNGRLTRGEISKEQYDKIKAILLT